MNVRWKLPAFDSIQDQVLVRRRCVDQARQGLATEAF